MTRPLFISRKGLLSCPSCLQHIELNQSIEQTQCPFCKIPLSESSKSTKPLGVHSLKTLAKSRSAAALAALGLTMTVGCELPWSSSQEELVEYDDHAPEPEYGGFGVEGYDEEYDEDEDYELIDGAEEDPTATDGSADEVPDPEDSELPSEEGASPENAPSTEDGLEE